MNIVFLILDMDFCFETWKVYKKVKKTKTAEVQTIKTPEDCQAECMKEDNSWCQFFTWIQETEQCYLKEAKQDNAKTTKKYAVSGPKVCKTNGGKVIYTLFNIYNMCSITNVTIKREIYMDSYLHLRLMCLKNLLALSPLMLA